MVPNFVDKVCFIEYIVIIAFIRSFPLPTLRSRKAPDDLLGALKRHFLKEGYRPGDKVETELALADRFRVPRQKIREALVTLCRQGLLTRNKSAGTVVRDLDPGELGDDIAFRFAMAGLDEADAVEARLVIETAILPLAMQRITPSLIRDLESLLNEMEKNISRPEEFDRGDYEFHLTLLKACGNRTLALFGGVIQGLFSVDRRRRFWKPRLFKRALQQHRQLLDAIRQSDVEAATRLLKDHLSLYEQKRI